MVISAIRLNVSTVSIQAAGHQYNYSFKTAAISQYHLPSHNTSETVLHPIPNIIWTHWWKLNRWTLLLWLWCTEWPIGACAFAKGGRNDTVWGIARLAHELEIQIGDLCD